jgi:ATP-binding cassette subfamily B protein
MIVVTQGSLRDLRIEMFQHMESLPIKYFDTHPHGDIMSMYTNDIDTLRQMISQSMTQLINSSITVVSIFTVMVTLSIPLTLVTCLMVGVMFFLSSRVTKQSSKNFVAQQARLGKLNGYIEEMMTGQKVIKVFVHEKEVMEQFDELNESLFDAAYKANAFSNMMGPINAQLGNLSYVLCVMIGAMLSFNSVGGFTVGALATFLTLNKSFSMPINQLTMQANSILMALAGAERIFKLLDEKPEVDDGYVVLVNAKEVDGKLTECEERTGR